MSNYKPDGYQDVMPYMLVEGAEKFIDFMKEAFGAEELGRYAGDDGRIMHAAVRIGDTVIELSEGSGEYAPRQAALHIYVEDVDAVYAKALAAGATSLAEVEDKFYGERSGGVTDHSGNHWYIATRIEASE
jgi:uncharacterized glyoxalase superfamily protein PhnB